MLDAFWSLTADVIRRGLNVDEPEGRPVPGRELLPEIMRHNMVIPPRKFVGRHRRHESMVPDAVAHVADEDRSSSPLYPSWLPGGVR